MNIVFIAQWLFVANFEILHCSDVLARRQKLFRPESISCKQFFFTAKIIMASYFNYVIATLRALFAWRS